MRPEARILFHIFLTALLLVNQLHVASVSGEDDSFSGESKFQLLFEKVHRRYCDSILIQFNSLHMF